MSDPNFLQQAGHFAAAAEVDPTADNLMNQGVKAMASHLPGEQMFDQAPIAEVDRVANNEIDAEISKIEGRFGGGQEQQ